MLLHHDRIHPKERRNEPVKSVNLVIKFFVFVVVFILALYVTQLALDALGISTGSTIGDWAIKVGFGLAAVAMLCWGFKNALKG